MLRFVVRRLAISILLIVASSMAVFALVASLGDPLAALRLNPDIPAAEIEHRRHELGLDDPLVTRYAEWAGGLVHGDMGRSLDGREVRDLVWQRLQVTARMVVAGLLVAIVGAIGVGAWAARRPYSWADNVLTAAGLVVLSLPAFWLAGLLKEYLAIRSPRLFGWRLVATLGEADPNLTGNLLARLGNYASHLILPTICLSAVLIAVWSRYLRAMMIETLGRDWILAARARGVSESRLTFRHALRNTLGPLSALVAVDLAQVVGGVVVLERIFGWQGMGDLLLRGVSGPDVNIVLAWLIVAAAFVVAANLGADVLAARLDPRIRVG